MTGLKRVLGGHECEPRKNPGNGRQKKDAKKGDHRVTLNSVTLL